MKLLNQVDTLKTVKKKKFWCESQDILFISIDCSQVLHISIRDKMTNHSHFLILEELFLIKNTY